MPQPWPHAYVLFFLATFGGLTTAYAEEMEDPVLKFASQILQVTITKTSASERICEGHERRTTNVGKATVLIRYLDRARVWQTLQLRGVGYEVGSCSEYQWRSIEVNGQGFHFDESSGKHGHWKSSMKLAGLFEWSHRTNGMSKYSHESWKGSRTAVSRAAACANSDCAPLAFDGGRGGSRSYPEEYAFLPSRKAFEQIKLEKIFPRTQSEEEDDRREEKAKTKADRAAALAQLPSPKPAEIRLLRRSSHQMCVATEFELYCLGRNLYGESPPYLRSLMPIDDVALGKDFTCLLSAGEVFCFGREDDERATYPPVHLKRVRQIAAGDRHACAIDEDGVKCWGLDFYGQAPAFVEGLRNPRVLSVDHETSCALDDDGVKCWGGGYGPKAIRYVRFKYRLTRPRAIAATDTLIYAIDDAGVRAWSATDGYKDDSPFVPNPELRDPSLIRGDGTYACTIDEGDVKCWGMFQPILFPALRRSGLKHARDLVVVDGTACALDREGVKCWNLRSSAFDEYGKRINSQLVDTVLVRFGFGSQEGQ